MKHAGPTRKILEREASLRARLTPYRELAISTGYSEQYIANFISRLAKAKREKDNNKLREGRRYTDAQINQFAADLTRK